MEPGHSRHSNGFAPFPESYFAPLRSFATYAASIEAVPVGHRKGCETMRGRQKNAV